jgi:hypothetical protein
MANKDHIEIVRRGNAAIGAWRKNNPETTLDLSGANLQGIDLQEANLGGANLQRCDLSATYPQRGVDLRQAKLKRADLRRANLRMADLTGAELRKANLSFSQLSVVDFSHADLRDANLEGSYFIGSIFHGTKLSGANLEGALIGHTKFANVDLSNVGGLETVKHEFPSFIDIDTLFRSKGDVPRSFFEGCGIPDIFLTYLPEILGATEPIQFYSCFISYSSKDEEFAKRLYSRMRDAHIRVWFAPENVMGGKKLHEQIERAIHVYDRLLLVLSKNSMQSEWVMTEIRNARKVEAEEKRRKLFPIRLVDFETIKEWRCFDADFGKDLAVEVREYFIPDFSHWTDHDAFEAAFARLLHDLKAEYKIG